MLTTNNIYLSDVSSVMEPSYFIQIHLVVSEEEDSLKLPGQLKRIMQNQMYWCDGIAVVC